MEALEAVQKHAFAVRSMHQGAPLDGESDPPITIDHDDAMSEEDILSEPGSRQTSTLYVSL